MRYLKNFENHIGHNLSEEDLEYIRRREIEDEEDEYFNRIEEVKPEFETDTDELPF